MGPEITSLRFTGNDVFSDDELSTAIITRATRCRSIVLAPFCVSSAEFALDREYLDHRILRDDAARLVVYHSARGYREAVVDTAVTYRGADSSSVAVEFRIQEGTPTLVDSVTFLGIEDIDAALLVDGLRTRTGAPFDLVALEADRDTILARLRNTGYAHADVLRYWFMPSDRRVARVTFDIETGPVARFGEVRVEGTQQVDADIIQQMLPFRAGGNYSRDQLLAGQRSLYGLALFRSASIEEHLDNVPNTVVPITVRVTEGDIHRMRTGGGWSTAECLNIEGRWVSRNFRGGARRLELRSELSNLLAPSLAESACRQSGTGEFSRVNWLVSAEFTQPFIFLSRNSLTASLYVERQSLADVFVRRAVGSSFVLSRVVGRGERVSLGYRPQIAALDAAEVFFCTSFLVCRPEDVDLLQSANWLSPVGLAYSRDRTDQVLNPTTGLQALLDLELARGWTGSDFQYDRAIAEAAWYRSLSDGVILALRARGGWLNAGAFRGSLSRDPLSAVVHPQKRFYAGGSNSVRGFAQNQLGPRVLTVESERLLETREGGSGPTCVPAELLDLTCDAGRAEDLSGLVPSPTGGTSVVVGNAELRMPMGSQRVQAAAFLDFGQVWEPGDFEIDKVQFTPGLGIRYFSPIGPIRVDLGYRFQSGEELRVVTSQLRPFDPTTDADTDRIIVDGQAIDYVETEELALLGPRVLFGASDPWSLRRFQLHLSIGQAF